MSGGTFATFVNNIVAIANGGVIPLLYALAFLFFLYGVVRYVFSEGEENRTKAKQSIMYGLIGLVVIFVVCGLVDLLLGTLNSLSGVGVGPRTS